MLAIYRGTRLLGTVVAISASGCVYYRLPRYEQKIRGCKFGHMTARHIKRYDCQIYEFEKAEEENHVGISRLRK